MAIRPCGASHGVAAPVLEWAALLHDNTGESTGAGVRLGLNLGFWVNANAEASCVRSAQWWQDSPTAPPCSFTSLQRASSTRCAGNAIHACVRGDAGVAHRAM
jgi:hypothetical protein